MTNANFPKNLLNLMERIYTPDDAEQFVKDILTQYTDEEQKLLGDRSENTIALLFGEYDAELIDADEKFMDDEELEEVPHYYTRKLEYVGVNGCWHNVDVTSYELYPEDFVAAYEEAMEYLGDTENGRFSMMAIDFK